jgi:drug/metabolite transporter (DMT)-like permease
MQTAEPGGRRWYVDVALVSVALIWGATFVLVKEALADISTLLFLALRFSIATAALGLIFGRAVWTDLTRSESRGATIAGGIAAGICLFAGYVFQTFGLKYTTAAKTGFITGLYIPLVPLVSAIAYRKLPRLPETFGVALAFGGMALMTVQSDLAHISRGDLLVSCCAMAYALHMVVLGQASKRGNIPLLTIVQIATAAILGAGVCGWAEQPRIQWTAAVWIALGTTGLLATAVAFAVQTWGQQYSSPTRTALIFSTEPVFAWLTAYLFAGEVLSPRGVAGAGLILAGILLVELKPARVGPPPSTESVCS